jgi:cellulose synthase/poly-beta-1,6-N-acetylglucosamine synthase-like glycosyltransferase
MPPLRKIDRRVPEKQMTEIKMSPYQHAATTPSPYGDTHRQSQESFLEPPPSAHPIYGNYSREPSFEHQNVSRRPGLSDQHHRTLSDLMPESVADSPLDPPHGVYPSFAPGAHSSYSGSQTHTRSSSPYPSPSPFRSQETLRPLYPDSPSTFFKRDWVKEGLIAQLHTRDDREFLAGRKRWMYRWLAPLLCLVSLAMYWFYFGLRVTFIVDAQQHYGSNFPLAWIFVAIEISIAVPIFMQTIWSLFILKKRHRPKLRLVGNDVPTVDVFITCCGEDDDLVLDTVRAACDLDYPQDRYRVLILDDGKSDHLKTVAEDLRETFPNIYYIRRPKFPGVPHHFKAGNLNNGLDTVHTLPGGAGEYMAALDADMIPEQCWLRAILPHLIMDEKMGLACPPQLFYNVPRDDPLCQSLDFFVHVSEPVKDALGVAWCTGSGYIARTAALAQIGNFPCGSLAEDVATSTLLLGAGWRTAFVHEALQFGTVPEDYGGHLKQRTRWAIGTVDTAFKLKFCLWGDKIKHMTFAQRSSSFIYAFLSLFNICVTLSIFALPIVLISNRPLVAYSNDTQLRWLIRTCFANVVLNRLCEFLLFIPAGYTTGQRSSRYQLWMAPYITLTIIRSFVLPTWLGGQRQAFKATGSIKSAINERDPKTRAPMFRRLWTILVNYMAGFHVSYVYFVLTAVTMSTYRTLVTQHTLRGKLVGLITHAFWVSFVSVSCLLLAD